MDELITSQPSALPAQKTTSLVRSTALVSGMTLISRILGFMRDVVCAHFFGATVAYDAFVVAFRIPNFLRRLFAEGAFSQALVPMLTEYRANRSNSELKSFLNHLSGVLVLILSLVVILSMLSAPLIIKLFAPGFGSNGEKLALASDLLKIMFPYLLFISLTSLCASVLNCFHRFGAPAFTPTLLNLAMMIAAIYFSPYFAQPITALAWGVFIGGCLQLSFQIFYLRKIDMLPIPRLKGDWAGVKSLLTRMLPAIFGVSIAQISLLIDTILASFLPSGSISWLYYSERLMQFPLGIFGVALATVSLPHLSHHHSTNNHEKFFKTLDLSLKLTLLIGVPATLGLCLLAQPMMITLFDYGKFSALDAWQSSRSLQGFSVGLIGFIAIKILGSAYYARKNISTPVRIGVISLLLNIVLSIILMQFWQHAGLALAVSISNFANAIILLIILWHSKIYRPAFNDWFRFLGRIFSASIGLVLILHYFCPPLERWQLANISWRAIHLSEIILVGTLGYLGILKITGMQLQDYLSLKK